MPRNSLHFQFNRISVSDTEMEYSDEEKEASISPDHNKSSIWNLIDGSAVLKSSAVQMYSSEWLPHLKVFPTGKMLSTKERQELFESIASRGIAFEKAAEGILAPYRKSKNKRVDDRECWLNNIAVNEFFIKLSEKYPHTAVLDSGYFNNPGFIEDVINGKMESIRNNLTKARAIFCPVIVNLDDDAKNKHWVLLMAIKKEKPKLAFAKFGLDSLNLKTPYPSLFKKLNDILFAIHKEAFDFDEEILPVPLQHNTKDCGLSVAYFAEKTCEGQDLRAYRTLQSKKCDYTEMRQHFAQILAPFANKIAPKKHRAYTM